MYKFIPMERARLLPCEAWRLWDIPSPVYHPICPFQNLCQRLEEAVGSHRKARARSRKVDFHFLRCLHGPQAKLC